MPLHSIPYTCLIKKIHRFTAEKVHSGQQFHIIRSRIIDVIIWYVVQFHKFSFRQTEKFDGVNDKVYLLVIIF